ncbi:MAG: hypothetical protein QM767_19490 [Anaeromyxobacter sp.]
MPSGAWREIMSVEFSARMRKRSSLSRSACSIRVRSVMSSVMEMICGPSWWWSTFPE